jgi:FMN phosphatase YigB (HAD superfamily)
MNLEIRALCSDLDATLYDYDEELGPHDYTLARQVMEGAGLDNTLLHEIDELYKTTSFSEILKTLKAEPYSVGERILKAGYDGYNNLDFDHINPSPDVIPSIEALRKCGVKTSLVTTGVIERQKRKVSILGLDNYFDEFCYVSDFSPSISKGDCFREFADEHSISYNEVMVVGDKISKEIKEGNELGMVTVQILQGRHKNRTPRDPLEIPDHKINTFSEILGIIGISN